MEESLLADKESIMMGIASRTSSGQRVVDCSELQRESKYQLEQGGSGSAASDRGSGSRVRRRGWEAVGGQCDPEPSEFRKISGQHYGDRIPAGKRGCHSFLPLPTAVITK